MPEDVAEQPVKPVPGALSIQRNEEQIRAFDLLELESRALVIENGVAKAATHLIEDRRAPKKAARLGT